MTRHAADYLSFRANLNKRQLDNLKARLTNLLAENYFKEDALTIVKVGTSLAFHIYVDQHQAVLWLLGGHWVRLAEPSPDFKARMKEYADLIRVGGDPN